MFTCAYIYTLTHSLSLSHLNPHRIEEREEQSRSTELSLEYTLKLPNQYVVFSLSVYLYNICIPKNLSLYNSMIRITQTCVRKHTTQENVLPESKSAAESPLSCHKLPPPEKVAEKDPVAKVIHEVMTLKRRNEWVRFPLSISMFCPPCSPAARLPPPTYPLYRFRQASPRFENILHLRRLISKIKPFEMNQSKKIFLLLHLILNLNVKMIPNFKNGFPRRLLKRMLLTYERTRGLHVVCLVSLTIFLKHMV